jgi:hypothetical protein
VLVIYGGCLIALALDLGSQEIVKPTKPLYRFVSQLLLAEDAASVNVGHWK